MDDKKENINFQKVYELMNKTTQMLIDSVQNDGIDTQTAIMTMICALSECAFLCAPDEIEAVKNINRVVMIGKQSADRQKEIYDKL